MDTIKVKTDTSSLGRSTNQSITGVVFFDFGIYRFPEKGWNDVIVVVLGWWLSSLENIVVGRSDRGEFRFMDGPLYIRINKLKNGSCRVECLDKGVDESIEYSGCYQFEEVLESVLDAAKSTSYDCSQLGWNSDDVDKLNSLIAKLSK